MTPSSSSWIARRIQRALELGLTGAYNSIRIDPARYLLHLRRAHGLPVDSFDQIYVVHPSVLDSIADQTISATMRLAATEGAGLGAGGIFTLVPDLGVLSALTFRMIQKLSLIYGFEYSSDQEKAELWIAAASAAGVDLGKELLEKEVIQRFVPRVIERIAVKAGTEMAEKWVARVVPLVSSVVGGALNYYFVRAWGRRARQHFRNKHLELRRQMELSHSEPGQLPRTPSV